MQKLAKTGQFWPKWPKTGLFSKWAQQMNSRPSFLDSAFNLDIGTAKPQTCPLTKLKY